MDELQGEPSEDPPGLVLTEDMVREGIQALRLKINAAPGPSGWTYRLIVKLCVGQKGAARDEARELIEAVARLFNLALDGALPPDVACIWATARAVLIPKLDGGWRPLNIGECWYRLLARIACKQICPALSERLVAQHQLAVGVSGGCEIGARLGQVAIDYSFGADDVTAAECMCLVNGDRHNAFNLQPRGPTFEATKEVAPLLSRFYRTFYGGKETRVYNSRGEFIGLNATGVRQGDPAGSVFFCIGDHAVLTELNQRVREICAARGCTLPALAYGYADDNTIAVSDAIAAEVAEAYVEIVTRSGGRVNEAKSSILVRPGRSGRVCASPFRVLEDGVKLLGNPVGTVEFRREFLRKEISAMSESIPTLTQLVSP
jgi:hypothetical protein